MSNAERLLQGLGEVFIGTEVTVDEALIDRMVKALEPITSDEVVTVMAGPDDSFVGVYEGRDRIRDGWTDWLEAFTEVRFELEDVQIIGENVLTTGHQIGRTRSGGVELEQPSAAVWKFSDDVLVRIEFHLDREKAQASAEAPAA